MGFADFRVINFAEPQPESTQRHPKKNVVMELHGIHIASATQA